MLLSPGLALGLALLVLVPCVDASSLDLPPSCSHGAYRNADEDAGVWRSGCPGFTECEPGFWCDGSVRDRPHLPNPLLRAASHVLRSSLSR